MAQSPSTPSHREFVRRAPRKGEGAEQAFKHVTVDEGALMRQMHEDGNGVKKIAATLHRFTDTVPKHVFKKHVKKAPHGRPVAITPATYKKLEKVHKKLLKELPGHCHAEEAHGLEML